MFTHYRTIGFILKKTDRGESDQLFVIYTKDFGKLKVLGKAIRKIKSKLRAGIELFYLSELEFIQGKAHKTLTDAVLIDNFNTLRNDPERLKIAYKISEILDNLAIGEEPDEKIWNLLKEVFNKLNSTQTLYGLIYYFFLWNFLSILGYRPELYNCSVCRKKITPEKLYFVSEEGGVICQNCFKKVKLGIEINPETVKILRIILEKDLQKLLRLKIEKSYLESLNAVSDNYLSFILSENSF